MSAGAAGQNGAVRCLALALLLPAAALAGPVLEAFAGASQSARGTLTVVQAGLPPVTLAARWDSEPFVLPPYWTLRGGWTFERLEVSAELVHHKLLLREPSAPVEQFSVSHGFNLVLASVAAKLQGGLLARAGAGVVVAHPENSVRGATVGRSGSAFQGYVLAGPTAQAGLERRWALAPWWSLCVELAFTAAWVRVPVASGHADLADFAAHARFGTAFAWPR